MTEKYAELRAALIWTAAALQAACDSGSITERDKFFGDSGARTTRDILDMADAALAQEQS